MAARAKKRPELVANRGPVSFVPNPEGTSAIGSPDYVSSETMELKMQAQQKDFEKALLKMEGDIKSQMKSMPTKWEMLAGTLAVLALIYAFVAFGGDRFASGIEFTSGTVAYFQSTKEAVERLQAVVDRQNEQIDRQSKQIDGLLELMRSQMEKPNVPRQVPKP
jgi:hypothetical protein